MTTRQMSRAAKRERAKGPYQAGKPTSHCHKQIKTVAQAAAAEQYKVTMRDNLVYNAWKKNFPGLNPAQLEERFVAKYWGDFIPFARATLARLLEQPIDPKTKEEIMEILILDNTLVSQRANPGILLGAK